MNSTPRQWIGVSEVARRTGMTPRTIQRWCRERWVEHHRTPGGRFRFTQDEADAVVEKCMAQERHPEARIPNPDFDPTGLKKVTRIERAPSRRGAA